MKEDVSDCLEGKEVVKKKGPSPVAQATIVIFLGITYAIFLNYMMQGLLIDRRLMAEQDVNQNRLEAEREMLAIRKKVMIEGLKIEKSKMKLDYEMRAFASDQKKAEMIGNRVFRLCQIVKSEEKSQSADVRYWETVRNDKEIGEDQKKPFEATYQTFRNENQWESQMAEISSIIEALGDMKKGRRDFPAIVESVDAAVSSLAGMKNCLSERDERGLTNCGGKNQMVNSAMMQLEDVLGGIMLRRVEAAIDDLEK